MIRRHALDYWKQITEAAPSAPWRFDPARGSDLLGPGGDRLGELGTESAGAFVAAAREAMPVLLAEHDHLVALLRAVAQPRDRQCLDCGPLDALGHRKRCRLAPYLKE